MENWKVIKDFDTYEVSDLGRVRNIRTGRIMKTANSHGYRSVPLRKDGKAKRFRVHRLVAQAFIPSVDGKVLVDHINENRADNKVSNLRWCTYQEYVDFHFELHPEKRFCKKRAAAKYVRETPEAKKVRLQKASDRSAEAYGVSVLVDGKLFKAIGQAARYVFEQEPNRGKEKTIRKEIQRVVKGTREPFLMYGRFTIGY